MASSIQANYLGLSLNSPIIVGACPLTARPESVREFVVAGAGAIVLPSLFQEQVVHRRLEKRQPTTEPETKLESQYYSHLNESPYGSVEAYIELIRTLKAAAGIPIIASLNGCSGGSWLAVVDELHAAGADAVEASIEPDNFNASQSAETVEHEALAGLAQLCQQSPLPVSVKLSPFHTNLSHLAWQLAKVGVAGLVCFAHEMTWVVHTDRIATSLDWELTPASHINPTVSGLLRVRTGGPEMDLAASGGISLPEDMLKTMIAGADVVMVTSEIYRSGPDIIAHLNESLARYLSQHQFTSFAEFKANRPPLQLQPRAAFLHSLTAGGQISDPTPRVTQQTGDRWGHLQ